MNTVVKKDRDEIYEELKIEGEGANDSLDQLAE